MIAVLGDRLRIADTKKMNSKITKSKWCWVASETKGGWRLKLSVGKTDIRLEGLLLATPEEVKKVAKGNIVFVHRRVVVTKKTVLNR